jgi:hypothetical protein
LVIGLSVGVTLLATSCCWLLVGLVMRKKNDKRAQEEATAKLMATYQSLDVEKGKVPAWGATSSV